MFNPFIFNVIIDVSVWIYHCITFLIVFSDFVPLFLSPPFKKYHCHVSYLQPGLLNSVAYSMSVFRHITDSSNLAYQLKLLTHSSPYSSLSGPPRR